MTGPDIFASIRNWAPPEVLEFLDGLLFLLPEDIQYRLKRVVADLPAEGSNIERVVELVLRQWKDMSSSDWVQIALVGPARTGKKSLLAALRRRQSDPLLPIFRIVDLQGLEEYLGYQRGRMPSGEVGTADLLVLVLDGRYQLSEATRQMYQQLCRFRKPIVVLNKMDLVSRPGAVLKKAREVLGTSVLGVSASRPASLDRLLKAIVVTEPRSLYALTRNFPVFRRSICQSIVTQAAVAAGLVGGIRLPVTDLVPLAAIQMGMVLRIARAFGHTLGQERIRELAPALVAGALVREGGHELRKRFPAQKGLIAVSVAGLWTLTLGEAAIRYFDRLSADLEPAPA